MSLTMSVTMLAGNTGRAEKFGVVMCSYCYVIKTLVELCWFIYSTIGAAFTSSGHLLLLLYSGGWSYVYVTVCQWRVASVYVSLCRMCMCMYVCLQITTTIMN